MSKLSIRKDQKPAFLRDVEDHGDYFVLRLEGPIGTHALEQNRGKMTRVIEEFKLFKKHMLCDFGSVQDCDTATMAALVNRLAELRKLGNKRLILFNVKDRLNNLFEIAHLEKVFSIHASETEAAASLK